MVEYGSLTARHAASRGAREQAKNAHHHSSRSRQWQLLGLRGRRRRQQLADGSHGRPGAVEHAGDTFWTRQPGLETRFRRAALK